MQYSGNQYVALHIGRGSKSRFLYVGQVFSHSVNLAKSCKINPRYIWISRWKSVYLYKERDLEEAKDRLSKFLKDKKIKNREKIVKELKDLGFECVVTSRSESKAKDNDKVDIIDKCGQLPFNIQIQIKKTAAT